jgi:DNA-binding transcriptional regulator PaaX
MSLTSEILFFLSNNPGNYRALRSRLSGYYDYDKTKKYQKQKNNKDDKSFRTLLSNLKKKGYLKNNKGVWSITPKGLKKSKKLKGFTNYHNYPKLKNCNEKIIISFDIPELNRSARSWLRRALYNLDFTMLQHSVWLGPSPLPEEFINDLKIKEIFRCLKFFNVKEKDIV